MLSVLSEKQNNSNKTHQLHKNWSDLGDMEKQKEREMNLKHIVCVFELIHKKMKIPEGEKCDFKSEKCFMHVIQKYNI